MTKEVRMIEKVTRVGHLYDIYSALLTTRQREMLELYYFDDWSLSEIADHLQVSRQAVHDNLRRAEEQLEHYERVLSLLQFGQEHQKRLQQLMHAFEGVEHLLPPASQTEIQTLLDECTREVWLQGGRESHV